MSYRDNKVWGRYFVGGSLLEGKKGSQATPTRAQRHWKGTASYQHTILVPTIFETWNSMRT